LTDGGVEEAEIQALYSRAVAPFWDIQAGLRYDIEPDGLAHGVVALNGLAPYWFEVETAAFLSEQGDLTARIEAEYELLLTQRLILQPSIEAELSAQPVPDRETGSGLTSISAGLRLRYEVRREFAPYLGLEWHRALGDTRDMIEATG
ncbi:MAG TPA: copper resistance protein CopB, partial [Hyphomonas sp.]|nr:copper resistance protein CopB [Hyphomonas sp.]